MEFFTALPTSDYTEEEREDHLSWWCPTEACSPEAELSQRRALLGEDRDHVIALGRSHSLPCVLLAINLVLHKEMSLLFEVDVAVRAGVTLGVTELVPQLHHHPPEEQT